MTTRAAGGTRVLLAACPAAFATFLADRALLPFLPVVAADLGVGVAEVGQVPALSSAVAAALGLALGPLADRFTRRMLALGVVAAGAGVVAAALSPTFALLAAAGLLVALGRAVVPPAALALVGARVTEPARGRAISYVVAAFSGVPIVGLPALAALGAWAGGWRPAFVALGGLALAVALLVRMLLPPDPRTAAPIGRSPLAGYRALLRDRGIAGIIGGAFLRNAALWMASAYWGAFLIQEHGFDLAGVGLGYTATGLGHVAGTLLMGRAIRRGTPLRGLLTVTTLAAGVALAAAMLSPLGPAAALALGTLGLLMIGGADVANAALLTEESRGGTATAMSLNQAGMNLGVAAGGAIGGLLLAAGGYGAIGAGIPAVAAAAAALIWLSRARGEV